MHLHFPLKPNYISTIVPDPNPKFVSYYIYPHISEFMIIPSS